MEVIRVLVEVVLVTVVVGRVLARRRFSTSAEHVRPVLFVGTALRGDGDRRVRRSFGLIRVCLTSALPFRRLAKSSSCTRLGF